ncbi:hypothetical protein G6F60_015429 [Rhizopus arrhizus]|nr:hypothetical protein G6F60_015429 [Rhizopus arrhizus]
MRETLPYRCHVPIPTAALAGPPGQPMRREWRKTSYEEADRGRVDGARCALGCPCRKPRPAFPSKPCNFFETAGRAVPAAMTTCAPKALLFLP